MVDLSALWMQQMQAQQRTLDPRMAAADPRMAAADPRMAMMQQAMALSPHDLAQLPPDRRQKLEALRAQYAANGLELSPQIEVRRTPSDRNA